MVENLAWGNYGGTVVSKPAAQREWAYSISNDFSGNAMTDTGTLSAFDGATADGASAILVAGSPDHAIIVWGWQAVYIAGGNSVKGHIVGMLTDGNGTSKGIVHASDDDNTVVMLPQPTKVPTGRNLIFQVVNSTMNTGSGSNAADTAIIEIYYNIVYVPDS